MRVVLCDDKASLAESAANLGAWWIKEAIRKRGKAVIVLSTGLSQLDMLSRLVEQDIPWEKVEAFHVDEYVGLSETDKASFRSYLKT